MARPYSEDLRERAVEAKMSCQAAADLFGVGVSSVVRWRQLKRATGSVAAKAMGGKRKPKLAGERDWILARIAAEPSLTLEELRGELAERGVIVGHATVWRFLAGEKLSFKKNPARQRAGAA